MLGPKLLAHDWSEALRKANLNIQGLLVSKKDLKGDSEEKLDPQPCNTYKCDQKELQDVFNYLLAGVPLEGVLLSRSCGLQITAYSIKTTLLNEMLLDSRYC
eukprot:6186642-Amphidinium_carterae.1